MIRYRTPGLHPLEIWHGIVSQQALYELRDDPEALYLALMNFLLDAHAGVAITRDPTDTFELRRAASFDMAILCGGGAVESSLRSVVDGRDYPFAVQICPSSQFVGTHGSMVIADEMQWHNPLTIDLGQSQLKLSGGGKQLSIPRDFDLLPATDGALDDGEGRRRLKDFVQRHVAELVETMPIAPDGFIVALPVKIDSAGYAGCCSYPGLSGDLDALFCRLFGRPWVVLNDAELAALGFKPVLSQKALVVTIGFGVGGALWHRVY